MDIYNHNASDHISDVYYQFGRKDPISGPRKIYIRQDNEGNYSYVSWNTGTYTIQNTAADANCNNVPYSIKHPLTFIKSNAHDYWTYNDKYNPTVYDSSIIWQDPHLPSSDGKSMFDPCPAGWKVPKSGTWDQFTKKVKFIYGEPISGGWNYFPNGFSDKSTGVIFYPISMYLYFSSGGFSYKLGRCWSCSLKSSTTADFLVMDGRYEDGGGDGYRGETDDLVTGMPVRCVQE